MYLFKSMEVYMEIAGDEIKSYAMDHHGLIAGICKDLKLEEKINSRMGRQDPRRIVSTGTAAIAMIINGLGFTNRRLYLTPQFFESKPVQQLLGQDISAKNLDDNALGKALDEIAEYGASKLFGELGFEIALENNLLGTLAHLDTTSLSTEGKYEGDDESAVKLTYGHSKDHRPDLKQVMMSLVVSGPASIPIWMEPQDGNSSDKKTFDETIKNVRSFQEELKSCPDFKWVADSALYNKNKLLKQTDYLWLSRVPETITEARHLVELPANDVEWIEREKGYKTSAFLSNYGEVHQRWLLVYSEQSYEREKKTFNKKLEKQEEKLSKLLWHLGNECFSCSADALNTASKVSKQFPYYHIEFETEEFLKHKKSGRPKKTSNDASVFYKVKSSHKRNEEAIETFLNRKGRFILATNDLDEEGFSDEEILSSYKKQQDVEKGFRFLKDPWFMVDSIFLKSPRRIEALMMIMTLCLMIYNIGQYRLRSILVETNETLPNQLNKPVQNPTLRWVFQIMEGIGVIQFYEQGIRDPVRQMITNLSDLRTKIIRLFGGNVQRIYGFV